MRHLRESLLDLLLGRFASNVLLGEVRDAPQELDALKPEVPGPKKWRVDIRFKKPDGTKVRDQRVYEAPTEGMAHRWGQSRESQLRAGSLVLGKTKAAPTFKDFVEKDWIDTYPKAAGNRHTTIKEKKSHLKSHLMPFFASMPIDRIDRKAMEKFVAKTFEKTIGKKPENRTSRNGTLDRPKTISAKRVKNIMGTLHTILNSAHEWGTLPTLPKFPQIKCSTPGFDFYDATESALLVASARDDERALILFALHTGVGPGDRPVGGAAADRCLVGRRARRRL